MTIHVKNIKILKGYFDKVVERTQCHAGNVGQVIFPLLGFIVNKMDENSDIQVRGNDATGNILWIFIGGTRYAFRYEHSDETIEIRENSYMGPLIAKVDNSTTTSKLETIFANL
jgi:hypothetical protein